MSEPRVGVGVIVRRGNDVLLVRRADHESGEAAVNADYELSEVAWFPNDGLPEPLFPPLRRLLDGEALR